MLIATEDEKSSKLYLERLKKELKATRVIVIADHEGSAPKSVVKAAKRARDEREKSKEDDPFDEVWVVFDTEGPQNVQRQNEARQAVEQARQLGFLTAVSNPSFEFWLLLHYEWFVGPLADGAAVCKRLKNHIKGYYKGIDAFGETWDKVAEARMRAEKVFTERYPGETPHPCDCHPCTQFHRLLDSLMK